MIRSEEELYSSFKERDDLILKLEENGFGFKNNIFYKKMFSSKEDKFLCFILNEYYGDFVSKYPKFGISHNLVRSLSFTLGNNNHYFDTSGIFRDRKDVYNSVISVFDSILNYFDDGKIVSSCFICNGFSNVNNEVLLSFANANGVKITFSSTGKSFFGTVPHSLATSNSKDYG